MRQLCNPAFFDGKRIGGEPRFSGSLKAIYFMEAINRFRIQLSITYLCDTRGGATLEGPESMPKL
jgi:hypothetical protein